MKDEILKYFNTLSYEEQQKILTSLHAEAKKIPYHITFSLDTTGIKKMTSAIAYCKKHTIAYTAGKGGRGKVRMSFEGLSDRNAVLIGRLTV